MAEPLLSAEGLARRLGHTVEWFYRNRRKLEAEGLPGTVRGCGNRWDPAAIDAWLRIQRGDVAPATDPALNDWKAKLLARLPGLAQKGEAA